MKTLVRLAIGLSLVVVTLVAVTYTALELSEVAIATTYDQSGKPRETHIWYVEKDGELLLEAGNPVNPWVVELRQGSTLSLAINDQTKAYTFKLHDGQQNHQLIRSLMREKYGWRDAWVVMISDVSKSAMLKVSPI
ncbi:MAG: hypothetical protein GKR90_17885 [Pseudomonadales bacterium]|nr:hypothetical protein [Pseudomonadales bacterium]